MDVVGHDDEVVELVAALAAVVLKSFQKEFGVGRDLKEAARIVGSTGDEVGAGPLNARGMAMIRQLILYGGQRKRST
jgi:hypothetical protein